jgi:hypothetical protein
MIKTAIIIILILLLLITLYSYYCLSTRLINFERARLEYILKKETGLNEKEKKIKIISDCTNKNEQYKLAIQNINKIIDELNLSNDNVIYGINNIITDYIITDNIDINILSESKNNNILSESENNNILSEVPVEYMI